MGLRAAVMAAALGAREPGLAAALAQAVGAVQAREAAVGRGASKVSGQCEYCHLEAAKLYRTEDDERICRTCWHDLLYCRMGGRIPQDPADR